MLDAVNIVVCPDPTAALLALFNVKHGATGASRLWARLSQAIRPPGELQGDLMHSLVQVG
jgi:hypothetical protein